MLSASLPSSIARRPRRQDGTTVLPTPSAPSAPSGPTPTNGGTKYYAALQWIAAGATKFDIYLDTNPTPTTLVSLHQVGTSFSPTVLPSTTYYWQVIAINDGGSTAGPIWSFTTPAASDWFFLIGGQLNTRVRRDGASLRDVLGAAANTGKLVFDTADPGAGNSIEIGLGALDPDNLLFAGEIQFNDQTYVDTFHSPLWPVSLVDRTFQINKRRPVGRFVTTSATFIGKWLVNTWTTGFTDTNIQANLPAISITFDGSQDVTTCLQAVATAINGRQRVDYGKNVWLYVTDTSTPIDPVDNDHPPLNNPSPITYTNDLSQVRTRVFVKGANSTLLTDVASGEVILPVSSSAAVFDAGGGTVLLRNSETATYATIQPSGVVGSLVGPGIGPASAPTLALGSGAGIDSGVHQYAVVFRTTNDASLSLPSPVATITTGNIATPSTGPSLVQFGDGSSDWMIGNGPTSPQNIEWAVTFYNAAGETPPGPRSNNINFNTTIPPGLTRTFQIHNLPLGPAGTTGRKLYRASSSGGTLKFVKTIADNTTTDVNDDVLDASLGGNAPSTNTATANQVVLTNIAIGSAGSPAVTERFLYRTKAGSSQLQYLATIADNTTTTYTDTNADSSLGANAPSSDTSGITQPSGQVLPGSTTMPVAGPSFASDPARGGWVVIGNGQQVIRYFGVSGTNLTGIPASGPGSITAAISYNSTVTAVQALVGVNNWNGVASAMAKGDAVHLYVQVDDTTAQATLALLERDDAGNATDGIREYQVSDPQATTSAMCRAEGLADLARMSAPIVSAQYYMRPASALMLPRSGKTVHIDTRKGIFDTHIFAPTMFDEGVFGLNGDYVIQDVLITFDGPKMMPLFQVTAASAKFSLQDLLRTALVR